jgi:hypothetical protein
VEANFFRPLARELAAAILGSRLEKVHGPAEGVLTFILHGQGRSIQLIFRPAKSAGLLFPSADKPTNPSAPPAFVMWLRKRLVGRRLLEAQADWANLRLGLALSPRDLPQAGRWLVFDLREGLFLRDDFAPAPEPAWPELARILDDAEIWREHPQITPPLRRQLSTLAQRDPQAAATLLSRLKADAADAFFLAPSGEPLAWQTPGAEHFASAMAAATAHGERTLFPQLALAESRDDLDAAAQAAKRRKRQLGLLDADEARHAKLANLSIAAEALQIALSGFSATPRADAITLEHPLHGPVAVPLDPRLSPAENMARLFAQAAKGRRGLAHVERRRREIGAGLPPVDKATSRKPAFQPAPPITPKRFQGLAVAIFRSSDGFTILRGKSSEANHQMLARAASPFDLWLHAAGGPSAHVILKRDYPDQPVPERTVMEAATLCAVRSWRKDDSRAEVMVAKVRDVRKVKGAALGSVAVDQVERTVVVDVDPGIEQRLATK